jgi:small-conductance mechanosensitive channel
MVGIILVPFLVGSAILTAAGLLAGSIAIGASGLFLGLMSSFLVIFFGCRVGQSLLLFLFTGLAVVVILRGGAAYLPACALTATLIGWEFTQTKPEITSFPKADQAAFIRRHIFVMLTLGGTALLITLFSLSTHFQLGFCATLSLGLASLLLFWLALRMGKKPRAKKKNARRNRQKSDFLYRNRK